MIYTTLRDANVARQYVFPHVKPFTTEIWLLAIGGEIGEAANIYKKIYRGDKVPDTALADELADILIYLDLLRNHLGMSPAPEPGDRVMCVPEESFMTLFKALGDVTAIFDLGVPREAVMELFSSRIIRHTAELADYFGYDLHQSIERKFNEASRRIGVDVFLDLT